MFATLKPFEIFPIIRQLDDAGDSTTYYMRAVVTNARTLATIATLNMTDNGSQLFSYNWTVPADTSGEGFYIEIRTRVYTDSGYTVAADNYKVESHTYLIQSRPNLARSFGGGGGPDIDYKKIQKMIDESVSKIKFPEIPKTEKVNLTDITKEIKSVKSALDSLVIPKPKETDLSGITSQIGAVLSELDGIKGQVSSIPEPKEVDLSPVHNRLDGMDAEMMKNHLNEILKAVQQFYGADMEEVKSQISELSEKFDKIQILIPKQFKEALDEEE